MLNRQGKRQLQCSTWPVRSACCLSLPAHRYHAKLGFPSPQQHESCSVVSMNTLFPNHLSPHSRTSCRPAHSPRNSTPSTSCSTRHSTPWKSAGAPSSRTSSTRCRHSASSAYSPSGCPRRRHATIPTWRLGRRGWVFDERCVGREECCVDVWRGGLGRHLVDSWRGRGHVAGAGEGLLCWGL